METDVLSMIKEAGLDPEHVHYGDLREIFLGSLQWLHRKSHETNRIEEPEGVEDKICFKIMTQLLQNDYLRGIIEGRFSNCSHDGVEHNAVFRVKDGRVIEIETKEFKRP